MRFKIASHARSHGVSTARIIHALEHLDRVDPDAEPGKLVFFGQDPEDTLLRIVGHTALEDPCLIIITHAMPAEWTRGRKW